MSTKIIINCKIGNNTKIWNFVNLYECQIGDDCMIGTFTEIQSDVLIGNKVRVQSHTFICSGVTIEDKVFIGHGVMFINDKFPKTTNADGSMIGASDWKMLRVLIKKGASIGSNATIMGGITIAEGAIVGAGAVVTKDVPAHATVVGNPARIIEKVAKNTEV